MDWNLISIITFYLIIVLFFIKNRKNIERQSIFLLYRTKKGLNLINKIAKKNPRFWKIFGRISMYAGFLGIPLSIGFLAYTNLNVLFNPSAPPGVAPVIPGVSIPGSPINLPFWYGIISLIIILAIHEGSHGIVARANKVKIESAGVGLLAFLPLAFVEPDEKELANSPLKDKLSIYGAGPFSNIILGFICFILLSFLIIPAIGGVQLINVTQGSPADQSGLIPGDIVSQINNQTISTTPQFIQYIDNLSPGETIFLQTDRGIIELTTSISDDNESRAYLGVFIDQYPQILERQYETFKPRLIDHITRLLFWLFALNLGIGLINLLPLGPLDGGRMVSDTVNKKVKNKKKAKKIIRLISKISLFLLLFAMLPFFFNLLKSLGLTSIF